MAEYFHEEVTDMVTLPPPDAEAVRLPLVVAVLPLVELKSGNIPYCVVDVPLIGFGGAAAAKVNEAPVTFELVALPVVVKVPIVVALVLVEVHIVVSSKPSVIIICALAVLAAISNPNIKNTKATALGKKLNLLSVLGR